MTTYPAPCLRRLAGIVGVVGISLVAAGATLRPPGGIWGFTAPWDPRSAASVRAHSRSLAVVVTGWLALDTLTAQPIALYRDTVAAPGARRFALVTNYFRDRFRPETIRRLAADSTLLAHTSDSLAHLASAGGYQGLVLDFEAMTPADVPALQHVIKALTTAAHHRHVPTVAATVIAADTLAYPGRPLLQAADQLIVMVYDQHWATGAPGPIASPDWARTLLAARIANAGSPAHLVVGLPVYGYEWLHHAPTVVVSLADAHRLATQWGTSLTRDSASANLSASGPDSAQIWVADAPLLDTLRATAAHLGVTTVALWRLGLEDSTMWRSR